MLNTRHKNTNKRASKQTNKQIHGQAQNKHAQIHRHANLKANKHTYIQTGIYMQSNQTNAQTYKRAYARICKHTDTQTRRHTKYRMNASKNIQTSRNQNTLAQTRSIISQQGVNNQAYRHTSTTTNQICKYIDATQQHRDIQTRKHINAHGHVSIQQMSN